MTAEHDRRLTEAIETAVRDYNEATGEPSFVTGWVLCTAEIDPANDDRSGIGLFYPNGNLPWPTALGIVEAARIRMHSQWAGGGE